ncbi:MAG TPA: AAA family ATPase [Candidatus Merdiplasma excrementigallinarum]|uniref:AAA family ATPase n=1 Tax=Candidatus Merdiplasma excrementigallinarum TaxID=2840864 RepID=A0A9D1T8H0_9FIRM|nr:AAA family ATPase [Candidatus Merdiplasma excrementigallinarum]
MQKILIHKLGPVEHCELEISDFTVFTGPQASGKSTIAKSVFFFKNIKNILMEQFRKQQFLQVSEADDTINLSFKKRIERSIRSNFLQIFGTTWHMDETMQLAFYYAENTFMKVSLRENMAAPNYIWIEFSDNLNQFIKELEKKSQRDFGMASHDVLYAVREELHDFFEDSAEIIYIPAGRSMITLLGTQLNYIYSSMDDAQKRNLDYCTQNYLERILQLKPEFSFGLDQMIQNAIHLTDTKVDRQQMLELSELMKAILQGEYRNIEGEERLQVSENKYVKINFASSGQQEVVWILNVVFYYLLYNQKAFFIIEEPESHLFPNAQKLIAEFISMAQNGKNQIFITTHSPYILGSINNMLYADKIAKYVDQSKLEKIISRNKWMKFSDFAAYYIKDGEIISCSDQKFQSIENEVIDGASEDINRDFEKMVLLKEMYEH